MTQPVDFFNRLLTHATGFAHAEVRAVLKWPPHPDSTELVAGQPLSRAGRGK